MENPPVPRHTSSQLTSHDARTADALYRSYGGRLFAYFRLMLASEGSAQRALADTVIAAATDAGRTGRLRDLDQYAPRLFALARTECHKYQSADAVGAGRHWTAADGISGSTYRPGLREVARRAVSRLAPEVREAYILSAPYNNLSLPQLAAVLEVGLDAAADLRAQAGLDFVRAVALCATEADFTELTGADLRIRAEESLARDAALPPPSLPMLSDPALAAFREGVGPPSPPQALSSQAPPPGEAVPPRTGLARRNALPPVPTSAEPMFPAVMRNPTRVDLPRADENEFGRAPDYTRQDEFAGPGYGGEPGSDYGEPDYPADHGFGGPAGAYRGPGRLTGPLRALTGPLPFAGRLARGGSRRRRALAWTGGGLAAAAVVVVAVQMLASGPGSTITLTHGGVPASAVSPAPGLGVPLGSPRPSKTPHARRSPAASRQPVAGTQSAPAPVAPQPTYVNSQSPAPVKPSPTAKPSPAPTKSSPKPTPTTPAPSTTSPTPSASTTSPAA